VCWLGFLLGYYCGVLFIVVAAPVVLIVLFVLNVTLDSFQVSFLYSAKFVTHLRVIENHPKPSVYFLVNWRVL